MGVLKYLCPSCNKKFDDDLLAWQYRRFRKQVCPFCGWEDKEKMPRNWWVRRVDKL
jgi:Zn ribbon nucleic-acid-binding protein